MAFDATLYTRILERSLKRAEAKAKSFCRSSTLRRFMYHRIEREGKKTSSGVVRVPHYWAKFLHDGRKALPYKRTGLYVWYKDPNEDPRLSGGYPIYRSSVRRLTKEQFKRGKAAGKLFLAKRVAAMDSSKENPFFSNTGGLAGLTAEVGEIAQQETYRYVEEQLKARGLKKKTIVRNV